MPEQSEKNSPINASDEFMARDFHDDWLQEP
jgi:hypothetical protein